MSMMEYKIIVELVIVSCVERQSSTLLEIISMQLTNIN
jgi:hypothetical protein